MSSLINKQLLLTAYAYLFIMEQQKEQQGSEALQMQQMQDLFDLAGRTAARVCGGGRGLAPRQVVASQTQEQQKAAKEQVAFDFHTFTDDELAKENRQKLLLATEVATRERVFQKRREKKRQALEDRMVKGETITEKFLKEEKERFKRVWDRALRGQTNITTDEVMESMMSDYVLAPIFEGAGDDSKVLEKQLAAARKGFAEDDLLELFDLFANHPVRGCSDPEDFKMGPYCRAKGSCPTGSQPLQLIEEGDDLRKETRRFRDHCPDSYRDVYWGQKQGAGGILYFESKRSRKLQAGTFPTDGESYLVCKRTTME